MKGRCEGSKPACVMVQGTGSNVGKSVLVAGFARAYSNRGMSVRPFKPQNMSNNAGVTVDGGEIGRAQMTQAAAARVAPSVHMNPVLLKPESETGAQVIVHGRRLATMKAREYGIRKPELLRHVLDSFARLATDADLILVEGAGSPAEVNLRAGDIANMGFAEAANIPVILVGDIDRGGVIASIVGTHCVLPDRERARVQGFIINKFRGDVRLFEGGIVEIERRTGWRCLGIVPHTGDAARLPAEDVLGLEGDKRPSRGNVRIAVPQLGRIANFDDLDPLRAEPDVQLSIVRPGEPLPGDADIVLLPGSKSTVSDLRDFRVQGWDIDLAAHVRRGGAVLGICGGYQMLGRIVHDPEGVEGNPGEKTEGLGLLDVGTELTGEKTVREVSGRHLASDSVLCGYEIHLGRTSGPDCKRSFAVIDGRPDGASSADGRVAGTYLHGLFVNDRFRQTFLERFGARAMEQYSDGVDSALDRLAGHLERNLDLDRILQIARGG